jgi:hypothetical protein
MQASSACALLRIDLSQIPLCSNYRHGKFTQPENVTLQGFVGGAAQRCKAEFLWHAVHREEPVWGTRTYRRLIRCASIASVPWITHLFHLLPQSRVRAQKISITKFLLAGGAMLAWQSVSKVLLCAWDLESAGSFAPA